MSLQGVKQLKELLIRYSDYDGSSKGIRDWMRLSLVTFALKNPEFIIKTQLKRNVHPFVRGYYLNGNDKTICIKNQSPELIEGYINDLRNQIGRKVTKNNISIIDFIYKLYIYYNLSTLFYICFSFLILFMPLQ